MMMSEQLASDWDLQLTQVGGGPKSNMVDTHTSSTAYQARQSTRESQPRAVRCPPLLGGFGCAGFTWAPPGQ